MNRLVSKLDVAKELTQVLASINQSEIGSNLDFLRKTAALIHLLIDDAGTEEHAPLEVDDVCDEECDEQ